VDNYIKSLQWNYKTELRSKKVKYFNAFAKFVDNHTVELEDAKGKKEKVTSKYFLIACGGRPNYGGYPGAEEYGISSDDIFWQKKPPGKTLVVGASYIALECAGFLAGLGFDTTVMVRSILLRGFDQDMANKIGAYMERHGVKFERGMVPERFEKCDNGKVRCVIKDENKQDVEYGTFDTVLLAIGRTGCSSWMNLEAAGVKHDGGKIQCDDNDRTNVENIYAIGDVSVGKPELTPAAIQAGRWLSARLFGGAHKKMDYENIATTVFTPIEFGTVGLDEEEAIKKLGKDRAKVYHTIFRPLEWNLSHDRADDNGYIKVVVDSQTKGEQVLGVHVMGPHAGEMIQGFAIAIKAGFTKEQMDDTVGIHPTMAEEFTTLTEVKQEGVELAAKGGC